MYQCSWPPPYYPTSRCHSFHPGHGMVFAGELGRPLVVAPIWSERGLLRMARGWLVGEPGFEMRSMDEMDAMLPKQWVCHMVGATNWSQDGGGHGRL